MELKQLKNNVEVVGLLKSKQLEIKSLPDGRNYMGGQLVVQSIIDNKTHEYTIKIFTMMTSKFFAGIQTVKNEFKTIVEHGDDADRIKVRGSLKLNEYYKNDDELIQYNEIRGNVFNRIDKNNDVQDVALASIEVVIESFSKMVDVNQLPIADMQINGFTVGWNSEVIELKNAIVKSDLVQAMQNLYVPNSTGRLLFKLNNYIVEQRTPNGFGSSYGIEYEDKNYFNNMEVVGGDIPFFGPNEYSLEEIAVAKQNRTNKLEELKNKNKNTNSIIFETNGFGGFNLPNEMPNFLD